MEIRERVATVYVRSKIPGIFSTFSPLYTARPAPQSLVERDESSRPIVHRNATNLASLPTVTRASRKSYDSDGPPKGPVADLSRIQGMVMRPVVATVTVIVRPEDVWVIV